MKEILVWAIHTPAGAIALLASVVALFAYKGGPLHRKAGTCFSVSMLILLVSGFFAAYLKESTGDMFLSAVVMYTLFTAWLTMHHKKAETGLLELLALLFIATIASAALLISAGWGGVDTPIAYLVWAGFAVLCAIGDARNLYLLGLSGTQRVIRHVWRIGFCLLWTALAFTDKIVKIVGSNVKELPIEQTIYIVALPTILILLVILYWIIYIVFFSAKRFAASGK